MQISYRYLFNKERKRMIRFLLSVTESMHAELKAAARKEGCTLNGLIRDILWTWLEDRRQTDG